MKRYGTVMAMLLFGVVASFGVLARPLLPVDETRYLAVAWEMRLSGNWLVPHLNGEIYAHKPPLLFWLINLVWSITGVHEIPARLVGPMFGVISIGGTAVLARRLWPADRTTPPRSALVLACTAAFNAYAGLTMFDTMLTCSVIMGVVALTFVRERVLIAWLGLGTALALGGLSKGPVILIYLIPVTLALPLWAGISFKRTLAGLSGAVAIGVMLVCVWLIPAILQGGPAYRDAALWTQSAGRVVNSFAHVRPWWFFLSILPLFLWPWIWSPVFWKRLKQTNLTDGGMRLCMIWAGSAIVIFSLISGKQIHYLLPALPAFALFFARATDGERIEAPAAALLPALLAMGFLLAATGLIPNEAIRLLAQPEWIVAAIGVSLLILTLLTVKWKEVGCFAASPLMIMAVNLVFITGTPGRIYDTTPLAALLAPHDTDGIALLDLGYAGEFSFTGRLRNPVKKFRDPATAEKWLAQGKNRVLLARLDGSHPASPASFNLVFRNHPYGIWRNDSSLAHADDR